jgi:hypothetical protein
MNYEEELIAQARELCEKNLACWVVADRWSVGGEAEQINAWTIHLAEMDEHEETWGEMGMGDGHKPMCAYDENSYPCDFLITKAKQLLGVSDG